MIGKHIYTHTHTVEVVLRVPASTAALHSRLSFNQPFCVQTAEVIAVEEVNAIETASATFPNDS